MSGEVSNQRTQLEGAKGEENKTGEYRAKGKGYHRSRNDRLILQVSFKINWYGHRETHIVPDFRLDDIDEDMEERDRFDHH